jgi:hypothetical protein
MAFLISESKPQVSGEFTHKDSETKFSRTSLGRVFIHDTRVVFNFLATSNIRMSGFALSAHAISQMSTALQKLKIIR